MACDSSWAAAARSQQLGSLRSLSSTSGYSDGAKKDVRVVGMEGPMTVENRVGPPRSEESMSLYVTYEERLFKVVLGHPLGADSSLAV